MCRRKDPRERVTQGLYISRCVRILSSRSVRSAVVFATALGTAFAAPVFYSVRNLGVLPGHIVSIGASLNNRGQVAGVSSGEGPHARAFRYTEGVGMEDLGALPGRAQSWGWGINDFGQVTGNSATGQYERYQAFRYTDGVGMQDLGGLPGDVAREAYSINNFGQVTGATERGHAYRYSDGIGVQDLGVLPGDFLSAGTSINDVGQVAGSSGTADFRQHQAFRYTDGVGMQGLGVLPGDSGSRGGAINNLGQVVGTSGISGRAFSRAFRYTDGIGMQELGSIPGGNVGAGGINDIGDAVFSAGFLGGDQRAFVYTDRLAMLVDLNTLIPSGSGWVLTHAFDINNSGQITGGGILNGQERAYLLTPTTVVPEPDTTGLLAAGLLSVAALALRQKRTRCKTKKGIHRYDEQPI